MLYNYIPHDNIQTICAPDGRWYPSDFLALDFITKLYHNRGETIIIKYKDGKFTDEELRTHSNNVEWSRVNDLHILKTDAVYSEEIDDFIFNENLDELNNKESIEKVKQALMARRKKDNMISEISNNFGISGAVNIRDIYSIFEQTLSNGRGGVANWIPEPHLAQTTDEAVGRFTDGGPEDDTSTDGMDTGVREQRPRVINSTPGAPIRY